MKIFAALYMAVLAAMAQPMPGTAPLSTTTDIASDLVSGIDTFLMRELESAGAAPVAPGSRERLRDCL